MKKILASLLTVTLALTICACGQKPARDAHADQSTTAVSTQTTAYGTEITDSQTTAPGTEITGSQTTAPGTEMTDSQTDIPPLESRVELLGKDGEALPFYSERIYFQDGSLVGDGYLIMMSVTSRLPAIADQIPSVDLGDAPEIRTSARDGVQITGGDTVNVYDESYTLLAENVPISELVSRGNAQWAGRTVYIYFTVTFRSESIPNNEKATCDGYFVKTVF